MKRALAATILAAVVTAGSAATAAAKPATPYVGQGIAVDVAHRNYNEFHHRRILPANVIVRSLRHRGYRHIRNIRIVRGDYIVLASRHHRPVRVIVDGRTARILSVQRLHRYWREPGLRIYGQTGNFSYSLGLD